MLFHLSVPSCFFSDSLWGKRLFCWRVVKGSRILAWSGLWKCAWQPTAGNRYSAWHFSTLLLPIFPEVAVSWYVFRDGMRHGLLTFTQDFNVTSVRNVRSGTHLTRSRVKPSDGQTLCGVFWPPPSCYSAESQLYARLSSWASGRYLLNGSSILPFTVHQKWIFFFLLGLGVGGDTR